VFVLSVGQCDCLEIGVLPASRVFRIFNFKRLERELSSMRKFLLLFSFLMTGCSIVLRPSAIAPQATPVLPPIYSATALSIQNVEEWAELQQFSGSVTEPIAAVVFTEDAQQLVAIHAPSGVLSRWRVADGEQLNQFNVGPVGLTAAAFDQAGRTVATAEGYLDPSQEGQGEPEFKGVHVWETATGKLLLDTSPPNNAFHSRYLDVTISADGRTVADASGERCTLWNGQDGKYIQALSLSMRRLDEEVFEFRETTFGASAFDPSGTWLACVQESGLGQLGQVYDRDASLYIDLGTRGVPLDLAFDPARKYLAVVTTKQFVLFKIQGFFQKKIVINTAVSAGPAADLAFSPDGTLLAIGTTNDWQIWSVEARQPLYTHEQGAYAMAFSPDGRLLAVGDKEGIIHLWGVP
jgi:WD40 repeat protein